VFNKKIRSNIHHIVGAGSQTPVVIHRCINTTSGIVEYSIRYLNEFSTHKLLESIAAVLAAGELLTMLLMVPNS